MTPSHGTNEAIVQLAVNALRQGDHIAFICASDESAQRFRADVEQIVGPDLAAKLKVGVSRVAPPDHTYLRSE